MEYQQLSLFKQAQEFKMYDGYEVKNNASIQIDGGKFKLIKGQIFYLVSKYNNKYSIALPNEQGGSYGFCVSSNKFKECFKYLNKKVYPKSKDIWNGINWVVNPDLAIQVNVF